MYVFKIFYNRSWILFCALLFLKIIFFFSFFFVVFFPCTFSFQPNTNVAGPGPVTKADLCNKDTDYSNEQKLCTRQIMLQFNLNAACSMNGTATIEVYCLYCLWYRHMLVYLFVALILVVSIVWPHFCVFFFISKRLISKEVFIPVVNVMCLINDLLVWSPFIRTFM